jgi:hypothetical protein
LQSNAGRIHPFLALKTFWHKQRHCVSLSINVIRKLRSFKIVSPQKASRKQKKKGQKKGIIFHHTITVSKIMLPVPLLVVSGGRDENTTRCC